MLREIWGRVKVAARAGEMQEEITRLRAENRALMNSILGIAGVPPVIVANAAEGQALRLRVGDRGAEAAKELIGGPVSAVHARAKRPATVNGRVGRRRDGGTNRSDSAAMPMPLRRKSWHQVNRMLEIDAARKKDAPGGGSLEAEVKAGG